MPGGGIFVGFKGTKHPAEVAKWLDFLGKQDNLRYWSENTANIPQNEALLKAGLDYKLTTASAKESMTVFSDVAQHVSPVATQVLTSPVQGAILDSLRSRMAQAVAGELSVDQAVQRAQQDIDKAQAAAKQ
jgi:alpha-1,4-digalacturonate transport system substrate-binding protein